MSTPGAASDLIETNAPAAPGSVVVTTPAGVLANGGITNDNTPTISGTGVAGDTVTVKDGNTVLGTAVVAANGTWSLPVTKPLSDGAQAITATQTDPYGNTSPAAATNFTIDTVADGAPTVAITNPSQNGVLNAADLAPNNAINLQIGLPSNATAGDTLTVVDQAGHKVTQIITAANIAAGNVVLTGAFSAPASGTTFTATATLTDPAGNVSKPGAASDLVEYSVPGAPTLVVNTPAGALTNGGITNDTMPTISGTGVAGDSVTVKDGNTVLGTVVVANNGTWNLPLTSPLASGVQNITATQADPYGNVGGPASTSFTVTNTTVGITQIQAPGTPATPAVTIANGGSTTTTTPLISGTVSQTLLAGEIVEVYRNGTAVGAATVSGTNWTYQDTIVANSTDVYTAKIQAGNSVIANSNSYAINTPTVAVTAVQTTTSTAAASYTENFNEAPKMSGSTYKFSQFTVTSNGYDGTGLWLVTPAGEVGNTNWLFDGTQNLGLNTNQVQVENSNFATTFTSNVGAFNSISFQYHDLQYADVVTFYNAAGQAFATENLNVVGSGSAPGSAQGVFSSGTLSQAATYFVISGTGDTWNMDNLSFNTVASSSTVSIANGGSTTATNPTVKGTIGQALTSGEVVEVYRNGTAVGAASVSGNNWSYTDTIASGAAAVYSANILENGTTLASSNSYSVNALVQAMASVGVSGSATSAIGNPTVGIGAPLLAVNPTR